MWTNEKRISNVQIHNQICATKPKKIDLKRHLEVRNECAVECICIAMSSDTLYSKCMCDFIYIDLSSTQRLGFSSARMGNAN